MQTLDVLLTIIYVVSCGTLVTTVLLQPGEGKAPTLLGSDGGVAKALGTQAHPVARRITAVAAALFVLLAVALGGIDVLEASASLTGAR